MPRSDWGMWRALGRLGRRIAFGAKGGSPVAPKLGWRRRRRGAMAVSAARIANWAVTLLSKDSDARASFGSGCVEGAWTPWARFRRCGKGAAFDSRGAGARAAAL